MMLETRGTSIRTVVRVGSVMGQPTWILGMSTVVVPIWDSARFTVEEQRVGEQPHPRGERERDADDAGVHRDVDGVGRRRGVQLPPTTCGGTRKGQVVQRAHLGLELVDRDGGQVEVVYPRGHAESNSRDAACTSTDENAPPRETPVRMRPIDATATPWERGRPSVVLEARGPEISPYEVLP